MLISTVDFKWFQLYVYPTPLPKKLKITPTTLCTIVDNASTVFPANLLRTSTSLLNHIFKASLSFDGDDPKEAWPPPPPPKTPVIARKIVEMVIKRVVNIDFTVVPCSRKKVRIPSAKDWFLSRSFSMICLILVTWVWNFFGVCDSISNLAFCSVFNSSILSLYSYLCSSE